MPGQLLPAPKLLGAHYQLAWLTSACTGLRGTHCQLLRGRHSSSCTRRTWSTLPTCMANFCLPPNYLEHITNLHGQLLPALDYAEHTANFSLSLFCLHPEDMEHFANFNIQLKRQQAGEQQQGAAADLEVAARRGAAAGWGAAASCRAFFYTLLNALLVSVKE